MWDRGRVIKSYLGYFAKFALVSYSQSAWSLLAEEGCNRKMHQQIKVMRSCIFIVAAIASINITNAKDDGRFGRVPKDIKDWIENLSNRAGRKCCAIADGFRPERVRRDIKTGRYKVQIAGHWYVVPDYALLDSPNLLGFSIVWYERMLFETTPPDDVVIRCFLPGSGT